MRAPERGGQGRAANYFRTLPAVIKYSVESRATRWAPESSYTRIVARKRVRGSLHVLGASYPFM
jgi:hypothetical protein